MNAIRHNDDNMPHVAVRRLIERHGLRPILLAVLGLALRRRRRQGPPAHTLSDHLRLDIGLPPVVVGKHFRDYR